MGKLEEFTKTSAELAKALDIEYISISASPAEEAISLDSNLDQSVVTKFLYTIMVQSEFFSDCVQAALFQIHKDSISQREREQARQERRKPKKNLLS